MFTTQSRLSTTLKKTAFENIVCKGENADNQNFLLFQTTLKKKAFENTVCTGENADNQHFLLFPQCFPETAIIL